MNRVLFSRELIDWDKQDAYNIFRKKQDVYNIYRFRLLYLGGGQWYEFGTKRFTPFVVSGSSPVIAYMMATGGLHSI